MRNPENMDDTEYIHVLRPGSLRRLYEELVELPQDVRVVLLMFNGSPDLGSKERDLAGRTASAIRRSSVPHVTALDCEADEAVSLLAEASHLCIASANASLSVEGERISCDRAARTGLINFKCDRDSLEIEAMGLAERVAGLAPLAQEALIDAVETGLELGIEKGLKRELARFSKLFSTDDLKEGLSAFFEKRSPDFNGR